MSRSGVGGVIEETADGPGLWGEEMRESDRVGWATRQREMTEEGSPVGVGDREDARCASG